MAPLAALLLLPQIALAAPIDIPTEPLRQASPGEAAAAGSTPAKERPPMELNLRARYLTVPNAIMDAWFFDAGDEGANPFERPRLRMYTFGVEYVLKPRPMNWVFYYEYVGNGIKEGYWDDRESPADHDDGDWLKPSNFGLHVLGFNYAHEIPISDESRDVWVSMLFGAGLGLGIMSGELTVWHPGGNSSITNNCLRDAPSFERKDTCEPDGEINLPGVLPILDLTMSTRVNFAERANARLDLGLHNTFYVGTAVGTVF
ncbi:MAG: hypothetical protein JNM72_06585 [Deltaproteobacteria bacterium]|jgi:hypothetical protein|nr:hypothetical protein [Deltaproteobacteria bacterium]